MQVYNRCMKEEDAIQRLSKLSTDDLLAKKQRWIKERERIKANVMEEEDPHIKKIEWCDQEIQAIDKVLKYRKKHPDAEPPVA